VTYPKKKSELGTLFSHKFVFHSARTTIIKCQVSFDEKERVKGGIAKIESHDKATTRRVGK
jgi:hypothetical protein